MDFMCAKFQLVIFFKVSLNNYLIFQYYKGFATVADLENFRWGQKGVGVGEEVLAGDNWHGRALCGS